MHPFTDTLLAWYADHKRELPWRDTTDPYRIWISEIILQQTRVAQGYGYFLRFVERFPDVESLAAATEDEVMKAWQGLGYYSRARNLHAAARSIGGSFPTTYEGVRALKGVGDYTAAAICSFAYGLPHAVVDGNVYRVLSRYFGIDLPIDSTEGKKAFAALAREMLSRERPADYNQAIMDFGALQCTPQSPRCLLCPLAEGCAALAEGRIGSLPVKQHKIKVTYRYFHYFVVRTADDALVLHQRTGSDIWKSLYELPLIESEAPDELQMSAIERMLSTLFPRMPLQEFPSVCLLRQGVKHVLTHRVIMASFYELQVPSGHGLSADYLNVKFDELENYALPRLVHSFLNKLADSRNIL